MCRSVAPLPMVTEIIASRYANELTPIFERLALPFAPVRKPGDLVDDPHLNSSGGLLDVRLPNGKGAKVPVLPVTFDGERATPRRGIPGVGADTRSVLQQIDLSEGEIAELFRGSSPTRWRRPTAGWPIATQSRPAADRAQPVLRPLVLPGCRVDMFSFCSM